MSRFKSWTFVLPSAVEKHDVVFQRTSERVRDSREGKEQTMHWSEPKSGSRI
jgi:hypothetical protein